MCVVGAEGGRERVEGGECSEACAEGAKIEGDRGAARPGDGLRMLCTSPSRVHCIARYRGCTQANLDEHLVIGRLLVDLDLYLAHLFVDVDD